jgi:tetratricopeptide (TPR) repeat protein
MAQGPLRVGVLRLLEAARNEEWTLDRSLGDEREDPAIRELVARATAGRRAAAELLRKVRAGEPTNGCGEPVVEHVGGWERVHTEAHHGLAALLAALAEIDEDGLATEPGIRRDHPQYVWRDVVNHAARGPLLDYARWHHSQGREVEAIGVLSRWYEAVRGAALPTKALSDASYDLAGGLARAGRLDDAMHYLPDAFSYNDRAAVPVLKAWARTDRQLAGLADRPDFRTLVGA